MDEFSKNIEALYWKLLQTEWQEALERMIKDISEPTTELAKPDGELFKHILLDPKSYGVFNFDQPETATATTLLFDPPPILRLRAITVIDHKVIYDYITNVTIDRYLESR